MNKKRLIIYVSFVVLGILLIVALVWITKRYLSNRNTQFLESTGAIIEPKNESEQQQAALEEKLFKKLPIREKYFEITYKSKGDKYEVSLNQPYEASRTSFYGWINANGYASMPRTRFELVLK
jgi:hypothetical protein